MLGWLFKKARQPEVQMDLKPGTVPIVEFDTSQINDEIRERLLEDVKSLSEVSPEHQDAIYEAALTATSRGGDLHYLSQALLTTAGVGMDRAGSISRYLWFRSRVRMDNARRLALGITHARWKSAGAAPCGNPEMTALHKQLDGKRYPIAKGMQVGKHYVWPGMDEDCKCMSKSIIPGINRD